MSEAGIPIPRREFLRRGAKAAGAAAAVPWLLPASALGRDGHIPPGERIGMGFIGLGGQGTGHLLGGAWTYVPGGYAAREDVQVRAVCDVRQERREQARERCNRIYATRTGQAAYDGVQACNDFREVLARDDIDAVLLALPYHWACPMATMALRAGKDVYCEKPMCITLREGRHLAEACRRFRRVYQAGTQQRSEYGGKFRQACNLVRNGRIGELREVYAYRLPGAFLPRAWTSDESQPVPDGFDWDLWLGPLPWRPYAGQAGHALPGMFVGDVNWAPHHYDFIQWVLDADATGPLEAWPENDAVHLRYANGVVVHSTGFPGDPVGNVGGACFVGTEGRIAVDRDRIVAEPASILRSPPRPGESHVYHSVSHAGNFLDCIRTRQPTICPAETAVRSMSTVLVGGIALALGRAVRWDPAREQFPGDAEANRLLAYVPRTPWAT
ncbi:MAG: Gfo/Idh/MocA family oxidoreductase [Lentisphaeria bacterium]|nr:Gfo/Idh/MocA family oxidoreductase [Lentisphaeria bacterium]